jgi:hypothetical protein
MDQQRMTYAAMLLDLFVQTFDSIDGVEFLALTYGSDSQTRLVEIANSSKPKSHWVSPYSIGCKSYTPTLPAIKYLDQVKPTDRKSLIVVVTDGQANRGGMNPDVESWIQNNPQSPVLQIIIGDCQAPDIPNSYRISGQPDMTDVIATMQIISKIL